MPACCGSASAWRSWPSVLLAFVPRLPSADASNGFGLSNGSVRITSGTNRRLRLFAVTQIAASFVLLAGAGMLLTTLIALQRAQTGFEHAQRAGAARAASTTNGRRSRPVRFYKEAIRRISELPGVERVAVGTLVPWREAGAFFAAQFTVEGYAKADGEDDPRGQFRTVSPGFFAALGVPIIAGRDFNAGDRSDSEKVVIVSQSLAQRLFPESGRGEPPAHVDRSGDEVHRRQHRPAAHRRRRRRHRRREHRARVRRWSCITRWIRRSAAAGCSCTRGRIRTRWCRRLRRIIRDLSAEQPVEQAATLEDVRAEVLAPNRLNALVFGGFAGVALTIAVVGVAGVLAFSVSARTREFGVRLAIGSTPRHLLTRILGEGAVIAGAGIAAGVVGGLALARVVGGSSRTCRLPGVLPLARRRRDSGCGGDSRVADAGRAGVARRRHAGAAIGIISLRASLLASGLAGQDVVPAACVQAEL